MIYVVLETYDAKINFSDVAFQVRTWDAIIYNYLKKKNIVIPQKDRNKKDEKYAGAYVKEPVLVSMTGWFLLT